MTGLDRIDLAHLPDRPLGRLTLRPPLRTVVRDDGASEVLEPRVMQVLLALVRANGAIVSRSDLSECCWDGRVVGDDAINRVIYRLRRVADGIGERAFRVETVTKVGYRLVEDGAAEQPAPIASDVKLDGQSRRGLLIGGGAAIAAAGAGAFALLRRQAAAEPQPPELAALMAQGNIALGQASSDGTVQAIGLFRRAIDLQPDYADGWGALALAYAHAARRRGPEYLTAMQERSRAAGARATALDPGNPFAVAARALLMPGMGAWWPAERMLRAGLAGRPDSPILLTALANVLASVGRCVEQAQLLDRAVALSPASPGLLYPHVQALWAAGRLEEAERAMDRAFTLFSAQYAVWFTRFYLLLYTGRPTEAKQMVDRVAERPAGITAANFETIALVAQAMTSRRAGDIDAAMNNTLAAAHTGAGHAENCIQFASALGRLDDAFAVADGYYLGRGFAVSEVRFAEQGTYTRLSDRRSNILFLPSTAAMRADARFARLVDAIGLARYWAESGSRPDYRR